MNTDTISLFEGDRAVSPVIGVALMIGIVVVLAGTIGFAVLDFGDDVGAEPQASVDVEQIENSAGGAAQYRVTWISEGNSDYITFAGHNELAANASDVSADSIGIVGADDDVSAGGPTDVTAADASPGIATAGESFKVVYKGTASGQVTISAAIAGNPEDTTAVVDSVEN